MSVLPPVWLCTGDSCDEDFDGCGDGPCTAGTNCTDLTPAEEAAQDKAFNCSACPEGYEDNDGVCVGRCWLNLFTQTMCWLVLQVMKTMTESVLVGAD